LDAYYSLRIDIPQNILIKVSDEKVRSILTVVTIVRSINLSTLVVNGK